MEHEELRQHLLSAMATAEYAKKLAEATKSSLEQLVNKLDSERPQTLQEVLTKLETGEDVVIK